MTTQTMKEEFEAKFVLRFAWSKKGRGELVQLAPDKLIAVLIKDLLSEQSRRKGSR